MLVVRPAGPADLDSLMELAVLSGRGFTSLPEDEATLLDRLTLSEASFTGAIGPREAWYTLMLEDSETGRIEGLCGVRAAVGVARPHFSFRVMTLAQFSSAIGTRFDHQALVLVNECAGWTEVGSLYLRPERRSGGAGSLLARSRYMLIGVDRPRFAETVMAELRGYRGLRRVVGTADRRRAAHLRWPRRWGNRRCVCAKWRSRRRARFRVVRRWRVLARA